MSQHNEEERRLRVWGPSVPHSRLCQDQQDDGGVCICMKKYYCAGCDTMHTNEPCPRTVLDEVHDAIFFKQRSLKQMIEEILDSADARSVGGYIRDDHIKSRIDELAERHGNLGLTRKKIYQMTLKAQKARWRRQSNAYWRRCQ